MSIELYWLTLSAALTSIMFLPYCLNRAARYGVAKMMSIPPTGDDPFKAPWAHRAFRAHMNALECLITFAPLALAVHLTGIGNGVTETACAVFFFARLTHAPAYIFNVPMLRPAAFLSGLGAVLVLAYQLIVS